VCYNCLNDSHRIKLLKLLLLLLLIVQALSRAMNGNYVNIRL
jgi:hypothetical protein